MGKDNEAKGFNDQSKNLQLQAVTPTATPTQPPTPPPTTGTLGTLNICKTVVNQAAGANFQPSDFGFTFSTPANPNTFQGNNGGCTAVTVAPGAFIFRESFPELVTAGSVETSGGCLVSIGEIIQGTIAAGETQTCTITNTIRGIVEN